MGTSRSASRARGRAAGARVVDSCRLRRDAPCQHELVIHVATGRGETLVYSSVAPATDLYSRLLVKTLREPSVCHGKACVSHDRLQRTGKEAAIFQFLAVLGIVVRWIADEAIESLRAGVGIRKMPWWLDLAKECLLELCRPSLAGGWALDCSRDRHRFRFAPFRSGDCSRRSSEQDREAPQHKHARNISGEHRPCDSF